jgi:hypothetical protein
VVNHYFDARSQEWLEHWLQFASRLVDLDLPVALPQLIQKGHPRCRTKRWRRQTNQVQTDSDDPGLLKLVQLLSGDLRIDNYDAAETAGILQQGSHEIAVVYAKETWLHKHSVRDIVGLEIAEVAFGPRIVSRGGSPAVRHRKAPMEHVGVAVDGVHDLLQLIKSRPASAFRQSI